MTIEDDVLEALSEALDELWNVLTPQQKELLSEDTVTTAIKNHEWSNKSPR